MTPPLDDISFLVRSTNRVAVLQALADGPHTRRELVDQTPASRVTVGRILSDFDDRGWIRKDGRAYEATRRGRIIGVELGSLRTRLHALDRLDRVLEWLPVDRLDVPLEGFVDARVTTPTSTEPNHHHQRIGSVGATAERARMYSRGVTREALGIHRSAVEERGQRLELVLTREAFEVARASEGLREDFSSLVSESTVRVVDESLAVPFLALFDGLGFVGVDDDGSPVGVVETDSAAVVDWAERTLDDLAARAPRVDPESVSD